jgi:hypothetical protein
VDDELADIPQEEPTEGNQFSKKIEIDHRTLVLSIHVGMPSQCILIVFYLKVLCRRPKGLRSLQKSFFIGIR